MRTLLCVALLVVLALAKRPRSNELEGYTFSQYVEDFAKGYKHDAAERDLREKLFNSRLEEIKSFNKNSANSWKKGVNQFTDWTPEERRAVNRNIVRKDNSVSQPQRTHVRTLQVLPNQVDYRNSVPAILTAVKDQGMCGSCWAHAATESVETHNAMATGQLYALSQQQVTSCTANPLQCGGTGGCLGATAEVAWDGIVANGGIAQEWTYSYSSYFGVSGTCQYNVNKTVPVVKLAGYTSVMRNDVGAVMDAVATAGPLAISVDASMWFEYESGVYTGCHYNISMDHAVQLVGYGHDSGLGMDYWIVRNSWSPGWGEAGFIRLYREAQPECGWNNDWITAGGGCKGGANTVWACGQCGILFDTVYPNIELA